MPSVIRNGMYWIGNHSMLIWIMEAWPIEWKESPAWFPVFFFLVQPWFALTTMTRMVDEQRSNIGTMKALGYGKGSIALKYLLYAFIAGVIGSIVGCALGMWIFPTVIFNAWNLMYNLPSLQFVFQPGSDVVGQRPGHWRNDAGSTRSSL